MSDDLWMLCILVLCGSIVAIGAYRSSRTHIADQPEIDTALIHEGSAAVAQHLEDEAKRSGVRVELEQRSQARVGSTNEVEVFGCRPGTLLCINDGPDLKLLYRQEGWTRCG